MTEEQKKTLIDMLHAEACSCIISRGDDVMVCHERGVKDLYRLLMQDADILKGALVADKVVGKGAAALMIEGGVDEVYADVISQAALDLLMRTSVRVKYAQCVAHIINRAGDGICPVESLCNDCATAAECIPLITQFVNNQSDTRK